MLESILADDSSCEDCREACPRRPLAGPRRRHLVVPLPHPLEALQRPRLARCHRLWLRRHLRQLLLLLRNLLLMIIWRQRSRSRQPWTPWPTILWRPMTPERQRHQRARASLRRHLRWYLQRQRERNTPGPQLAGRHLVIPVAVLQPGRHASTGNGRRRRSVNDVSVLDWTTMALTTSSSSASRTWRTRCA